MTAMLEVKGWKVFQHYRDRTAPPWIKLHSSLLHDHTFGCLQDASKAHLMLIWLLASRNDGRIPDDAAWVQGHIGAREPVDLEGLIRAGFLIRSGKDGSASAPLAKRKQKSTPEREIEVEAEAETHTLSLVTSPNQEPLSTSGHVARIRGCLPAEFGEAFERLRRASHSPPALEAEIVAIMDGMRPGLHGVTWAEMGLALHDLSGSGYKPAPGTLRRFVETARRPRPAAPRRRESVPVLAVVPGDAI